jgi:hypothetical protein
MLRSRRRRRRVGFSQAFFKIARRNNRRLRTVQTTHKMLAFGHLEDRTPTQGPCRDARGRDDGIREELAPGDEQKRGTYQPRIVGGQVMMPADLNGCTNTCWKSRASTRSRMKCARSWRASGPNWHTSWRHRSHKGRADQLFLFI